MPLKNAFDSSRFGTVLEEFQHRFSDLTSAFSFKNGSAIPKVTVPNDFLVQLSQTLKKLGSLDVETLKAFQYIAQSTIQMYQESLQRRLTGKYEVDEFGLDQEVLDLILPLFAFLYEKWWRVTTHGIQNIPTKGAALLVANHSGVLPWDGAMIGYSIFSQLTPSRNVRALYHDWFTQLPFVAPFLARIGGVHAAPENAERVLKGGNLACVFPEGIKGVAKLFKHRYQLARFGRGGFVKVAIRSKAPIIPVSVVGGEEIYPTLARADWIGKPIGSPFFPITPFFPWMGLLGLVPLPSKWSIHFGKPISTAEYSERDAENFLVVQRISHRVRDEIQQTLQKAILRRKAIFF